jgi:hypothetical protein
MKAGAIVVDRGTNLPTIRRIIVLNGGARPPTEDIGKAWAEVGVTQTG